jgi:hypothetical protein
MAVSDEVENIENSSSLSKCRLPFLITSPVEPLTTQSTAPVTTVAERQRRQRRKA